MSRCLFVFLLFPLLIYAAPQDTCLIFTEVMFDAVSGNNEFIELYNRSETESVDLFRFKIKYATSNPDTIISAGYGTILPPKSYAVIFEGDYNFTTGIYKNLIPVSALQLKITDNAFGSNGMANTSNRPLWLIDGAKDTLDVYTYSANNANGFSDEKTYLNRDSSSVNWENSTKFLGTPGFRNSVVPSFYDLSLVSFKSTPLVLSGSNVDLTIKVVNKGIYPSGDFYIKIYNDIDKDSIPEPGELILSQNRNSIEAGDSSEFILSTNNYKPGKNYFIGLIESVLDEYPGNNSAFTNFNVVNSNSNRGDVVINEIMYAPHSPEPEWFELYNRSSKAIDIRSFKISDKTDTVAIINSSLSLNSNNFLIVAHDSTIYNYYRIGLPVIIKKFPSLNNTGDRVMILDSLDRVMDSLEYSPVWGGNNGISLERISVDAPSTDPLNWKTSVSRNHGTLGYINSVSSKDYDVEIAGISFSPEFPVAGDNADIFLDIKNRGNKAALFSASLYEDTNLDSLPDLFVIKSENINLAAGDSVSIKLNYTITGINKERGFYAFADYTGDQDTSNNSYYKIIAPGYPGNSIIINEIMYDPEPGESEWVELKNISTETINLKNWSVSDITGSIIKSIITEKDYFLLPGEFLIASRDSSFIYMHPGINNETKIVPFGTLGNTEDGVIVFDNRGGIADSVMYKSTWGHIKGYSIERISGIKNSCDSSNWVISLSGGKSTPGMENSVLSLPEGRINDLVINEIMFDPLPGNNEFIEFINLKKDSLNIGGWSIEDQHGNKYRLSDSGFVIPPDAYFVLAADSNVIAGYNLSDYNYKNVLNETNMGLTADELILLKDIRGYIIDSVYYSDKWHNKNYVNTKGRSLERINPGLGSNDRYNWSTSVDPLGATPGRRNSIFVINEKKSSGLSVSPNPFSPDNDGFEDCTIINYTLSIPVSQINVKVFDSRGRLVRTLSNNMASGHSGSIVFDGYGDDRIPLRMGIYILYLEALNSTTGQDEILKSTVVVARKLK
jgi:hypothetical protein